MNKPIDIADQFEVKPEHRDTVTLLHVYEGEPDETRFYVYTGKSGGKNRLNSQWHHITDESPLFRRKNEWVPVRLSWASGALTSEASEYEYNTRTGDVRRLEE